MNERIETLAKVAGYDPITKAAMKTLGFDVEKFAELIVKECIDVGLEQKKWVEDQTVFDPRDENWNRARIQQSQHIVDKIREHFGVE